MPSTSRFRGIAAVAAALVVGTTATACAGGSSAPATSTTVVHGARPVKTYAAPAGLVGAAQPQPNGALWVLATTSAAANLQQLNLTTGSVSQVIPVSSGATSLAQSSSGVVGVGVATSTTGALELRNGQSGALVATVPIGAPVKGVFAGADGSTFYVLDANATSASVTLVNATSAKASVSVPVPLATVAIAVSPGGQDLYALSSSGTLDVITVGSGQVASSFPVGAHGVALAVSPTGSQLYVLKRPGSTANVGVIRLATETQQKAVAAPADSVSVQVSGDGTQLYLAVGTPTVGNIQVFPAPV